MIRAGVVAIALLGACGQAPELATATAGLGSGMEDTPPDPCANDLPWTMCDAELNTWQKAPYVDSCWIGAPSLLPVHTTMQVIVTCFDYTPRVDGDRCVWDTREWELGRKENENHGTLTTEVCDHGPRKGEPVLLKTRSTGQLTDVEGGVGLLLSTTCTCDGFNAFMGADSLKPPSKLIDQVITALGNTNCDLTNKTPVELAAAVVSMLWYGNYDPLWQCAGDAVWQIRKGLHACNNDAAVEEQAFWNGGACPAADQLPGLCEGPRWYY